MDWGSIVYVDDDRALADVVSRRLRTRFDRGVETVESAEDALDRLDDGRVDCLVLDYRIPGEDPLSVLRDARARHPDVPVVFFTGIGDPETVDAVIEAGADAFVRKGPGGVDALADTLGETLEG
ncbi:CheY-like chemotaxis protein [Halarchaeum solikamskense]|uniref:response regulator n=1 Tax=Halarchaeum nitratireducens TaxID=489913 RepID=UPI001B3AFF58|nr:response regulator [Halarchaeum solikamskense]MBP2250059.1 CheY-like chemotaxis protein [Halarchaeum solikamskense]